ncbi:MAG: hypothetical protein IJ584_13740 [Bacteroidales bacterium]|nr:hypothetical protein [Bacteroidales bacterium]
MTIPFDKILRGQLEYAPEIYKAVTRSGKTARVICWDRGCKEFPLVALVDDDKYVYFYTDSGESANGNKWLDLMVEVTETDGERGFREGYNLGFELALRTQEKKIR